MSSSHRTCIEPLERRTLLSAGQVDVGFGTNGLATAELAPANASLNDIALMPDGRFLATATTQDGRLTVMRFHPDGTPDGSFGENGRATSMLRGPISEARAVAVQADAKPVVVGNLGTDFFILRYQTNGKHDRTFGEGGLVTGTFEGNPSVARDVAIRDDGRILVSGEATLRNFSIGVAVAQFQSDGAIDINFASHGDVVTKFDQPELGATTFSVNQMALAPNGSIYLAGRFYEGVGTADAADALAVMRFTANGAVDTAFGTAGLARRELAAFGETATGIVVDAQNRPIVSIGGAGVMGAVRFTALGRTDNSFGVRGASILSVTAADTTAITLQDDGRIVLGGNVSNMPRLARTSAAGAIDRDFGINGFSDNLPFQPVGTVQRLAMSPDGTILVAGTGGPINLTMGREMSFTRVFADDGPAGSLFARHLRAPRTASWPFQVHWRDPDGIDIDTLGVNNIRVTGPNNFDDRARLRSVDDTAGAHSVIATYVIPPPMGAWTAVDSGVYTLHLQPNQVADSEGNFAAARVLGTFEVIIGPVAPIG